MNTQDRPISSLFTTFSCCLISLFFQTYCT